MDDKIVVEALLTGVRNDSKGYYKELILLYNDGTWEKIFRAKSTSNMRIISGPVFRELSRAQAIAKLEKAYYGNNGLDGEFLD